MKKIFLILCFFVFILVISGCDDTTGNLEFSFDINDNYTGFKTIPESYTPEQAVEEGCYARDLRNQEPEEFIGIRILEDFLEASSKGKDTSIRIMSIYEDAIYYQDLFYIEGYYRIFDSSSEDLTDNKYKYVVDLKGRMPNAAKDSRFVVLTDDEDLTFEDVSLGMFSSSTEVINSISSYKIVLWD